MKMNNRSRLGLWGTLVSGMMLLVAAAAGSISSLVKDAEQYSCSSTCYNNYRWCLMQGKDPGYCSSVYNTCISNCSGGGGTAGAPQS